MAAVVRSLNTRQTLQRTHRNSPEIHTNAATTTHRISPWTHINVPHKSIRPVSIVGPTYLLTTSSASTWIFNKAGASSPQHSTGRQNVPTTLHNPPPTPPHLCARAARRAPMRRSCRTQHTHTMPRIIQPSQPPQSAQNSDATAHHRTVGRTRTSTPIALRDLALYSIVQLQNVAIIQRS